MTAVATMNQTGKWIVVERWDGSEGEWTPVTRPFETEQDAEDLYFNICRIAGQVDYKNIKSDSLGRSFSMHYSYSDTARDYSIAYYQI
jgi:hypothetical protein